jgi:hypothetical protein
MSEVRPYLKRLLAVIFVGIVMMAGTALFAWNKYGQRLKAAPPLPDPVPFHRVPAAP